MDVREKLVELPIEDALLILREEHRQRTDSYTTYLEHGGKGDPAEEVGLDALAMAISALEKTKWISIDDRLPGKEEYTATAEDSTEYYIRLLIAYKTDIVEYEIGYYDGYKWMTEKPIRLIKDVVAWMPFPNIPQPPKGELLWRSFIK